MLRRAIWGPEQARMLNMSSKTRCEHLHKFQPCKDERRLFGYFWQYILINSTMKASLAISIRNILTVKEQFKCFYSRGTSRPKVPPWTKQWRSPSQPQHQRTESLRLHWLLLFSFLNPSFVPISSPPQRAPGRGHESQSVGR